MGHSLKKKTRFLVEFISHLQCLIFKFIYPGLHPGLIYYDPSGLLFLTEISAKNQKKQTKTNLQLKIKENTFWYNNTLGNQKHSDKTKVIV